MTDNYSDSGPLNLDAGTADVIADIRRQEAMLKTGALQSAILNSPNFSIIATDEKGIIQLFNVGAERMLGYQAAEVVNKINPSDIHDPQEVRYLTKPIKVDEFMRVLDSTLELSDTVAMTQSEDGGM